MKRIMRAGILSVGILITSHCGAEEVYQPVLTALNSTTLSGYIDTSASYDLGAPAAVIPEPSALALLLLGGTALLMGPARRACKR